MKDIKTCEQYVLNELERLKKVNAELNDEYCWAVKCRENCEEMYDKLDKEHQELLKLIDEVKEILGIDLYEGSDETYVFIDTDRVFKSSFHSNEDFNKLLELFHLEEKSDEE